MACSVPAGGRYRLIPGADLPHDKRSGARITSIEIDTTFTAR